MLKILLAMALLLILGSASSDMTVGDQPVIALVDCTNSAGTAFRISPHVLISAAHVTSDTGCKINGQPYKLKKTSNLDYSILYDERTGQYLDVDCNGFVKDKVYQALGHPRALDQIIAIPIKSLGISYDHQAVLAGILEAQPGMSGGPVIDPDTMKVVGIVNAANWEDGLTFSLELKNTSVCATPSA